MRYNEFRLIEGYKEVMQKFSLDAELEDVKQMIEKYRDLVNRNQVQGNERNIDWWSKQGWEKFKKFVDAKSQQQSITQQKKRKSVGKSHNLAENDEWLIVIPLDKDASCFHGKGTDWCTTKPHLGYFYRYFLNKKITLIYFLQKKTGEKWAIAAKENGDHEYFDINDKSLTPEKFSKQTGINPEKYIDMAIGSGTDASKKVKKSRTYIQSQIDKMFQLLDQFTKGPSGVRDLGLENYIAKYGNFYSHTDYLTGSNKYFLHLLKKPVELDAMMQKVFISMWTSLDVDDDLAIPEKELLQNVTNLSEKSKFELLRLVPLEFLFGDVIPNDIQEKILDKHIILINQTDISLKDRHISEILRILLSPDTFASKNFFLKHLLNRADYDKIGDNLQDATKSVLDRMEKSFTDTSSLKAYEYFYDTLNYLEKIAGKIGYNPDPILDWAVQTYGIDYID